MTSYLRIAKSWTSASCWLVFLAATAAAERLQQSPAAAVYRTVVEPLVSVGSCEGSLELRALTWEDGEAQEKLVVILLKSAKDEEGVSRARMPWEAE